MRFFFFRMIIINLIWSEVGLQFQVQFIIKNYKAETEGLVEGLVKSQQAILRMIEKNPSLSKKEMAATIGISTTALDKNIGTLKKKGLLQRVGSAKGGHWKILI